MTLLYAVISHVCSALCIVENVHCMHFHCVDDSHLYIQYSTTYIYVMYVRRLAE